MYSMQRPNLVVETNIDQIEFSYNYELKLTHLGLKTEYFFKILIVQY